ncbi:bifunctional DNA primase/polymerase, partial [Acinetobacter baumannii]
MDIGTVLRAATGLPLPDAARKFAEAGVPVFPCRPRGKQPRTEHGFRDASTDLGQVTAWWRRWPTANIGVPTGAVSSFEVVDVDVHPGGT